MRRALVRGGGGVHGVRGVRGGGGGVRGGGVRDGVRGDARCTVCVE